MSEELSMAQHNLVRSSQALAQDIETVNEELNTLRRMHSQLARLNMERQRTIEALKAMAENLFAISEPFQSEGDLAWRATVKEYRSAMKLAQRDLTEMLRERE